MTAPPKGQDRNNVKALPGGKKGTSRKSIPPPQGDFALPPPKPEYYQQDGLRKLKPYMFTYHSWAKERWQGRTLIDIYSEFRDRTQEYYEWAIETGIIVVNNRPATPDQIIQNGDLISNVSHRHEPPVVAGEVKIIYDGRLPGNDGKTLVVEKPGSMPIHPTGRYNFNTLLEILKYDYDLPLVHTSNRLDRLTSGVMICSLTVQGSKELGAWFGGQRGESVKKEYVARCIGKFPAERIVCEEPLLTLDRQIGVNVVHPQGRESKTIFERLSYDETSDTSVVLCRPITGRTHQIRVHLQYLGHAIANDPIYQNSSAWGQSQGKGGVFPSTSTERQEERRTRGEKFMNQEKDKLEQEARSQTDLDEGTASLREGIETKLELELNSDAERVIRTLRGVRDETDGWARDKDVEAVQRARNLVVTSDDTSDQDPTAAANEDEEGFCRKCFTPMIPDPKPEQLFIWLHAMRYTTSEWDWKRSASNVSPLSRTTALPALAPLTSTLTSTTAAAGGPPPPYAPPVRSRSVPQLYHLSPRSIATPLPDDDDDDEDPHLHHPFASYGSLPGPPSQWTAQRRPRLGPRSRTSSSNGSSLGLTLGSQISQQRGSRPPSISFETNSTTTATSTPPIWDQSEVDDLDQDDHLEIQVSRRFSRRRQASDTSLLLRERRTNAATTAAANVTPAIAPRPSREHLPSNAATTTSSSSAPAPRSRIWTPLFFLLNFLSVIPSLIGFLYSAHRFYTTPSTRTDLYPQAFDLHRDSLQPIPGTGLLSNSRSTRLDWFVSGMWALSCAYFTHSLARGLLKRWLVYYPLGPTIVRVLSLQAICWPMTLTTHRVLSFDQPVAAWFVCATTAAISNVIQSWVTSNIVEHRKDRQGQLVSTAITAILGPGVRTDKYRKGERVLSWKRVLWSTVLPFTVFGWVTTNALLWQQFVARYRGGGGIDWTTYPRLNTTIEMSSHHHQQRDNEIRVLVLVSSSWTEQSRLNRQSFRQTSLDLVPVSSSTSEEGTVTTKSISVVHRFVIGTAPSPQVAGKMGSSIEHEANEFGDMLSVATREPTQPASIQANLKMLLAWQWVKEQSDPIDYVIRTQDDVFVRFDLVANELIELGRRSEYWQGFVHSDERVDPAQESNYDLTIYPPYTTSTFFIVSRDLVDLMLPTKSSRRRFMQSESRSVGLWLYPSGIHPIHDHRIQDFSDDICENDLIAVKRTSGRARKDLYDNVQGGYKLCRGFKPQRRTCGICYPTCRKRIDHWSEHVFECDRVKGLTTKPSTVDLVEPRSIPKKKKQVSEPVEPKWIVPNILPYEPSSGSTHSDPKTNNDDEYHLVHFTSWLSSRESFGRRQLEAIETLLVHEPRTRLIVLTTTLANDTFVRYQELGYDVHVVSIDQTRMIERGWYVGPETQRWVNAWDSWSTGNHFLSHLDEYLRLVVLFKFGGTYSDLDTLWICSPPEPSIEFVGSKHAPTAHGGYPLVDDNVQDDDDDGRSEFDERDRTILSTRIMRIRPGSTLLRDVLESTFSARYSRELAPFEVSRRLSELYDTRRRRTPEVASLEVVGPRSVVSLDWIDAPDYVGTLSSGQALVQLAEMTRSSTWAVQLLGGRMSNHLLIEPDSVVARATDLWSLGQQSDDGQQAFELRYPKMSKMELGRARTRFEGLDKVFVRGGTKRPFFDATITLETRNGGRIALDPVNHATKFRDEGVLNEVRFGIKNCTLREVNVILSSLVYSPPAFGSGAVAASRDELAIEVDFGVEKVQGTVEILLL